MTYAADRLSAASSLAEDGQVVTVSYVGTGVYDPATGTTSSTAPADQTVAAVILPLSAVRYAFHNAQGTVVEGDQQCLLAALNTSGDPITAPQVNGTITDTNGVAWSIITADPLSPGGLDLMHDCTIRRAQ